MTDFHVIDERHYAIHMRLENWANWAKGRPDSDVSPMFRLYRADNWERQISTIPVDKIDAQKIAKGVSGLPENHRHSLNWYYISRCTPGRAARAMGTTLQGLATYVTHARTMLVNRGV